MTSQLKSLVVIGRYTGLIEEVIERSGERFERAPTPSSAIKTYVAFKEGQIPYFFMISQNIDLPEINFYAGVISTSDSQNQKVIDQFKVETGFDLIPSEEVNNIFSRLKKYFPRFEKDPKNLVQILERAHY